MSTTTSPVRRRTRMLLVGALSATLFAGGLGAAPASAAANRGPEKTRAYADTGSDTNSFQCLNTDCTEMGDWGTSVGSGHGRLVGHFTTIGGGMTMANGDELHTDGWQMIAPDDVTCAAGQIPVKQTGQFAGGTGRFERARGDFVYRACVEVTDVSPTGRVTYDLFFVREGTITY